ncbi:MAG: TlyA family RNA methyltransferase [Ruminococcaceae bacterium]|nr:TlyA family RNA methyltransferase [Oscillospiraceae bacterium]
MKTRLDVYLTENGLVASREKARAVIMAGEVYINEQKADKAGQMVSETDAVEVRADSLRYVSRGGLKLEKAMTAFPISLQDAVCMDIGASTGGFTDCMLQNGAAKVYSIDVGYGQLAWSLRTDERVVNLERTNIRYVTENEVPEPIDFASVDVSFISLRLVLPVAFERLRDGGEVVCLIKPQFEAGREKVGKGGVVRDKETHIEVIQNVISFARETGFAVLGLEFSPVKGPKGNIEYLLYLSKSDKESADVPVTETVDRAHLEAQ